MTNFIYYIRLDKANFSISRNDYYLQLGLDERLLDRSLDLSQTKIKDGYHYFAYLAKQPHGPDIPATELQCIVWEDTQSFSNHGTLLIRNLTVTYEEGV